MTQLFDAATYEDADEIVAPFETSRHLRSMPAGDALAALDARKTQWRLDEQTIEVGRKGIQAAREALQAAARVNGDAKPAAKHDKTKAQRKAA